MPAYRYLVRGVVQGVGFRYFVLRHANVLGVRGYAHNREDGLLEVVAEAPEAALEELERLLRQGPAFAEVAGVERDAMEPRGDRGFEIR